MTDYPPESTAAIAGQPIHAVLVPFPIVCFTLTLLTDIAGGVARRHGAGKRGSAGRVEEPV